MLNEDSTDLIQVLKDQAEDTYFMYKICEGCDKLLLEEHPVCPNCKSYRFNTEKRKVIKEMKKLIEKEASLFINLL